MTIDGVNMLKEYGFGISRLSNNMDFLKRKKQAIHSWDDENGEEYMVDQGDFFYEPKDILATCFIHGISKADFQAKVESVKTILETPGLRTICFDSDETAHLVYAKYGATLSRMIKLNEDDNVAKFIVKLREPQPYNIQFKYDISGTLQTASITLSVATGYTADIHWGDGEVTTGVTGADQVKPHTYPRKNVYYVTIIGDVDKLTKMYIGGSVVQYIYGDPGKIVKKMSVSATDLLLTGSKVNRYSKSIIPSTLANLKLDDCAIISGDDICQVLKDIINDGVNKLADRLTSMNIWLNGGTNALLPTECEANFNTIEAYLTTGSIRAGYDDYFLPSKDEATAMRNNLHLFGVGGFSGGSYYWTSSEVDAMDAYATNFNDGGQVGHAKYMDFHVRACRSFTAAIGAYSLRDVGPGGGLIFYIDGTTYLEAAPSDQSTSKYWSNIQSTLIGTTSTDIGEGQNNTNEIIGQSGHTDSSAKICDDFEIKYET